MGEGGGEPGGDAFAEFCFGDVTDAFEVVVADVFGVGSVGVDVYESRERVLAIGIVDFVRIWEVVRVLVDFDYFAVLDFDGTTYDFEVRRDDVGVGDEHDLELA